MSNVQFGVGFAPSVPAPSVVDAAKLAEQLGYDVFWITDSHMADRLRAADRRRRQTGRAHPDDG